MIQELFTEILPVNEIEYLKRMPRLNYTNQISFKKHVKLSISPLIFLRFLPKLSHVWHILEIVTRTPRSPQNYGKWLVQFDDVPLKDGSLS